jgi:hypothetical protein
MVDSRDAADRQLLDRVLAQLGTAWEGGITTLEADFEISIARRWRTLELALVTRGPERITFRRTVHRKRGTMQGPPPELPAAPEASTDELARIDAAFRRERELWLVGPRDGELIVTPLAEGLAALRGGRSLVTRRLGDTVMLYVREWEHAPVFCVAIELATERVAAARWVDLPMPASRRLAPDTIDFLDRAFREHGKFGAYGDVTAGLRALACVENFALQLRETATSFEVQLTPRDGHGHFLQFSVAKNTGAIDGCVAGHLVPAPPIEGDSPA